MIRDQGMSYRKHAAAENDTPREIHAETIDTAIRGVKAALHTKDYATPSSLDAAGDRLAKAIGARVAVECQIRARRRIIRRRMRDGLSRRNQFESRLAFGARKRGAIELTGLIG